jgi:hypothetical protein
MIFCGEQEYKNRRTVKRKHPSAFMILKVDGGWVVFYGIDDYLQFKAQK